MLISSTPSFGTKVICWYTGFTFETFIYQYKSIVFLPLLEGFPFKLSKNASHTPGFIFVISCHESGCALLHAFLFLTTPRGSPYCHTPGPGTPILCNLLLLSPWGRNGKFRLKNPRVLLALVQTMLTCVFHLKSFVIVIPRYLMLSTFSRFPSKIYEAWIFLIRFLVSCIMLLLLSRSL